MGEVCNGIVDDCDGELDDDLPLEIEVVDDALASGLLRERTAELERLRATLRAAPAPAR